MGIDLKRSFIWMAVVIISLLLVVQLLFSYKNSSVIEETIRLNRQAEQVKVNTLDIIRTVHELDIGIRGYALIPNPQMRDPFDSAHLRIKPVFRLLERELKDQNFDMTAFQQIHDSVTAYFKIADTMYRLLEQNKREEFLKMLEADYGYSTWIQYKEFAEKVNAFEDNIIDRTNATYRKALRQNYMALVLLIVIVVPTLIFTALSTVRAFGMAKRLQQSEEERIKILTDQNITLEKLVKERTEEIATQNEEILSNLEFISQRNEQLEEAKKIIEEKSHIIETRNKNLGLEVEKQTGNLRESNRELVKNINQLEQFSYTVSHNLRSPVARLIGLTNILQYVTNPDETKDVMHKIASSAHDLDQVLRDLVRTIEVRKEIHNAITPISVSELISKISSHFEEEIKVLNIKLHKNLEAETLKSIPAYLESILFNLISNAIKYRNPVVPIEIILISRYEGSHFKLSVQDNGLGIDLEKNKRDLFSFYKRFHYHVEGRGLGLYLVKSQVELLGGTIEVTSEVNKGTKFTITLKHNLEPVTRN